MDFCSFVLFNFVDDFVFFVVFGVVLWMFCGCFVFVDLFFYVKGIVDTVKRLRYRFSV